LDVSGTDVVDIFRISGHPLRLRDLEKVFDNPPRYGKGFDWTGYTVHDAASLLIRFLTNVPESVVPVDFYVQFQDPIRDLKGVEVVANLDKIIESYQGLMTALPPLRRQLLLYLLDVLAVFASKSDTNNATVASLAAIFQPCILSPVKKGEDYIEEPVARRLSQDVLGFLIEQQDHFLIMLTKE
jgi:GTPase-activating protein SAC7